ncbi:SH3 domain-containing protein [Pelagibacterium montanilacus]|uniref:SH3 domain-containing protein n=1 Tax=Pelagibacterium montanilacus TaxID=2185280 RepID=UPI000F8EDC4B|nr:SH3 domain-containing protein [Pelagibacterium montanilacus]
MKTVGVVFAAAALGMAGLVSPASGQNGDWYGSYSLELEGPFIVDIGLDQLPGGTAGMASVFIYAEPGRCPRAVSLDLCLDITRALTAADPATNPANYIEVRGVRYQGDVAAVAFAFPRDPEVRIAQITRNGGQYVLVIAHPSRGVDLEAPIAEGPHSCAFAMCAEDRMDDLRANPERYQGVLADPGFVGRFPNLALAAPARGPSLWDVMSHADGRRLGAVYLEGEGTALSGQGALASVGFGRESEVAIVPDRARNEGFSLSVTFYADGSGERREGLLLLGLPDAQGEMEGTLIEGTHAEIVRLVRDDGFVPNPSFSDPSPDLLAEEDPEEIFDLPGIGVYGPSYVLRNIPQGQRLAVRAAPDRSAGIVGSLARDAEQILVLGCEPNIDSLTFEQADPEGRLLLLEGSWCEVSHEALTGWVAGTYLDPAVFPERL